MTTGSPGYPGRTAVPRRQAGRPAGRGPAPGPGTLAAL